MNGTAVRRWLAVLLVVSAALFAVGSFLEREESGGPVVEGTESVEHTGEGEGAEGTEVATAPEAGEELFGIDLESPVLVWGAVALSVLLAVALLVSRGRLAVAGAAVLGAAFAALDIREAVFQSGRGEDTLVLIAVALTVLHAAIALLGGWTLLRSRTVAQPG